MSNAPAFADVDVASGYAPALSIEQQAEILRAMVLRLPDGIAFADADGTTRLANDGYVASLDTQRAAFADRRTAELRSPAEPTPTVRQLDDGRWIQWQEIALPEGRTMLLQHDVTQQKQQEIENARLLEELQTARAQADRDRALMQSIVDNVADAIVLLEANGDIVLWNDAVYEINDFPREVFDGFHNVAEAFRWQFEHGHIARMHPTLEADVAARMARFQSGTSFSRIGVRPNGRWLDSRWRRLPDGRWLMKHTDVTELKRQELELRQSRDAAERERALMQAMLDNMTDGVALVEADGTIALWNDAILEINGFPPEVFRQFRNIAEVFRWQLQHGHQPRSQPTLEDDVAAAMARFVGGEPHTTILPRPNGSWVEVRWRLLPDGRRLVTHRDVTGLKRREVELEASRVEIEHAHGVTQTVLDNVTDGLALFDAEGQIVLCNRAFHSINDFPPDLFEHDKDVRVGLRWQLEHGAVPRTGEGIEAQVESAAGRMLRREPYRTVRAGIGGSWVDVQWIPLPDGRTLVMHRDITALKQRELELQQAREAVEGEGERLRAMLDNLPDGVALYAGNGDILHLNSACYELNRFPRDVFANITNLREGLRWQIANGQAPVSHDDIETELDARMAVFFRDEPYRHERLRYGRYLDVRWIPLPDGRRLVLHRDVTELRQREIEVQAARDVAERERATMRAMIDNMTDGVGLVEADGTWIVVNRPIFEINGFPADAFATIHNMDAAWRWQIENCHIDRRSPTIEEDVALLRQEFDRADAEPVIRRRPNGRWVERRNLPMPDGRRLVVHRDITALKQRELEVQEARDAIDRERETVRAMIDNMTDGIMLCERNGDIQVWNEAMTTVNGFPPDGFRSIQELLRWQFENGHVPDSGQPIEDQLALPISVFESGELYSAIRLRPNGRWVNAIWKSLPDGRRMMISRDVTELKQRELELQEARDAIDRERETMLAILDNMTDGVGLLGLDGEIIINNRALSAINQVTPEIGATIKDMRGAYRWFFESGQMPRTEPTIEADIERAYAVCMRGDGQPLIRHTPDGRWVEARFQRLADQRRLVVNRDITALKQQEQRIASERDAAETARAEAEAANQAKSTFLATMSHEIRTPMNGVLGMMEVLEHQGLDAEQRATLGVMRESAVALLRILDDVLDFSKIEAGRLELEEAPFSLADLVTGTAKTFQPQAAAKHLTIGAALDLGSADALLGDPVRVRQILFNLLGNAVKFTERGSIQVRAGTEPLGAGRQRVTLAVADTGIGLDAAERERLFQPFSQADSSTTRRFGGTGLGLSIVRRLAQLMGGDVAVESAPRRGSVFTVTLELRAAPSQATDLVAVLGAAPDTGAPAGRVLVVDDHPVNREVLLRQLGLLGIGADTAADGVEALRMWQPGRYVAVLADMHMPRLDGYGLTAAIRAREADQGAPRTPIVAVTANAMRGESERCMAAGMDAYLAKPVSLERLGATLRRWTPVSAPGTAAPAPTAPAIDRAALRIWMGDDEGAMRAVLTSFVQSAREAQRDIEQCVVEADAVGLTTAAHKLKGASLTIGAQDLAAIATQLETAAQSASWATCQAALAPLAVQLQRITEEVAT